MSLPRDVDPGAPGAVLIAGGGGGVGCAIAGSLLAAGHRIALVDRDDAALAEAGEILVRSGSVEPLAILADIADPAAVEDACDRVETDLGPVEVLVNAAGVYGERTSFLDSDAHVWWDVMAANLRGPMLCMRRLLPGMVERGRGYVVNVSSRAATWDDPGQSSVAYSTSKAALTRMTSSVAAEVATSGVVVVAVSPGMVRTAMTASRPDLAELPVNAFMPLETVASQVVSLVSGRYDSLSGRFVHAKDDLDDLVRQIEQRPDARLLSLAPTGPEDPVGQL